MLAAYMDEHVVAPGSPEAWLVVEELLNEVASTDDVERRRDLIMQVKELLPGRPVWETV